MVLCMVFLLMEGGGSMPQGELTLGSYLSFLLSLGRQGKASNDTTVTC